MPHYPEITYWVRNYAPSGVSDKRAVHAFVDCETQQRVKSLRIQLYAVASDKYDEKQLLNQLGAARKARHGTFSDWAKIMLQWLASYKS